MAKNVTGSAASMFMSGFGDKSKATFQMIPTDQIVLNPNNTAARNDTLESIRELADSIEVSGMHNPVLLNHIDGIYRMIAGERRYRATTECLHRTEIPSMVYENLSPAMERLVLLDNNLKVREYTAAHKLELYIEAEQTLRAMKASGEYTGGIQQGVAAMLGVSERQIRNYRAAVAGAGSAGTHSVTSITEAAAAAVAAKNKENSTILTELSDREILHVLQRIYNTVSVDRYYSKQLPTPKQAVAYLKPQYGYQGGSGSVLPDGRRLSYKKTNSKIEVMIDSQQAVIKYLDADRVIRECIAANRWVLTSDISPSDISSQMMNLRDDCRKLIKCEAELMPHDKRPSTQAGISGLPCHVTDDTFSPIFAAIEQLKDMLTSNRLELDSDDYDRIVLSVSYTAADILRIKKDLDIFGSELEEFDE